MFWKLINFERSIEKQLMSIFSRLPEYVTEPWTYIIWTIYNRWNTWHFKFLKWPCPFLDNNELTSNFENFLISILEKRQNQYFKQSTLTYEDWLKKVSHWFITLNYCFLGLNYFSTFAVNRLAAAMASFGKSVKIFLKHFRHFIFVSQEKL